MTRILEQCKGTIKDGLCMKCFNRTATSSSICIQMYEVEDKKAPVEEDPIAILIKHTKEFYVFGEKVDTVQLDKYQQAVKSAMQEFASQERQRTFQECIERLDFKSTGCGGEFTEGLDYAIEILRKLKK